MDQTERRQFLIKALMAEPNCQMKSPIPGDVQEQRDLLRGLMNIRYPAPVDEEILRIQDEYLTELQKERGITDIEVLTEIQPDIYLWQGDITTLRCDAIVNAANSGFTGCYIPCHACIDNFIQTYAGMQLRNECSEIIRRQGHEEETGKAKITKAYNLPCRYVLHTVGPIVETTPTPEDERLLSSCYRSCLELAEANGVRSIAFCCISTGIYNYPNEDAARIALSTVMRFKEYANSNIKVIFNVFKDKDRDIYERLLA